MNQKEAIRNWFSSEKSIKLNNLTITNSGIYHYNTIICERIKVNNKSFYIFNETNYSVSTIRVQSIIKQYLSGNNHININKVTINSQSLFDILYNRLKGLELNITVPRLKGLDLNITMAR